MYQDIDEEPERRTNTFIWIFKFNVYFFLRLFFAHPFTRLTGLTSADVVGLKNHIWTKNFDTYTI